MTKPKIDEVRKVSLVLTEPELRAIIHCVCTTGLGQVACHLTLIGSNGQDLGGWGEGPLTTFIFRELERVAAMKALQAKSR